jgi:hypothetical protein
MAADTDGVAGRAAMRSQFREGLSHLPPDEFPVTTALAEPLTHPDMERRFFFGLGLLIDGLTAKAAG